MAGLDPAIHVFLAKEEGVDARDKSRHDEDGLALDALNKRIEAMTRKAEQEYLRCFGERAAQAPRW